MHATTAEILQAFQSLTPAQLTALHKFAKRNTSAFFAEPLDLIHEALHRSLAGRRNWPPGIPFALYMVQTMKSIVGHDRERIGNQASRAFSIDEGQEGWQATSALPSVEEQVMAREEMDIARRAAERVMVSLGSDAAGRNVLDGMLAGMSPRETCDCFGMSSKDFDAARHRVMRRLRPGAMH